ncbi:hypothetical protein COBT_000097 [Conglomerata obtusa]
MKMWLNLSIISCAMAPIQNILRNLTIARNLTTSAHDQINMLMREDDLDILEKSVNESINNYSHAYENKKQQSNLNLNFNKQMRRQILNRKRRAIHNQITKNKKDNLEDSKTNYITHENLDTDYSINNPFNSSIINTITQTIISDYDKKDQIDFEETGHNNLIDNNDGSMNNNPDYAKYKVDKNDEADTIDANSSVKYKKHKERSVRNFDHTLDLSNSNNIPFLKKCMPISSDITTMDRIKIKLMETIVDPTLKKNCDYFDITLNEHPDIILRIVERQCSDQKVEKLCYGELHDKAIIFNVICETIPNNMNEKNKLINTFRKLLDSREELMQDSCFSNSISQKDGDMVLGDTQNQILADNSVKNITLVLLSYINNGQNLDKNKVFEMDNESDVIKNNTMQEEQLIDERETLNFPPSKTFFEKIIKDAKDNPITEITYNEKLEVFIGEKNFRYDNYYFQISDVFDMYKNEKIYCIISSICNCKIERMKTDYDVTKKKTYIYKNMFDLFRKTNDSDLICVIHVNCICHAENSKIGIKVQNNVTGLDLETLNICKKILNEKTIARYEKQKSHVGSCLIEFKNFVKNKAKKTINPYDSIFNYVYLFLAIASIIAGFFSRIIH